MPSKKKSSQGFYIPKKNLKIILIFLLGAAVMYFGQKYISKPKSTLFPNESQKTSQAEKKLTEDELPPGWKRFISEFETFSIGYPGDKKVIIDEDRPPMPICNLEAADVLLRIYPQDYAYIQEPAFGGDLLVSIVSLNNEDNISLKDWINTYCPEDWVRKSIGPLKVKQGEATRSYSRQNGKKMFIGHNYGGSMYFIYGFSSKTETIAEELFAEMLNTFQTPD